MSCDWWRESQVDEFGDRSCGAVPGLGSLTDDFIFDFLRKALFDGVPDDFAGFVVEDGEGGDGGGVHVWGEVFEEDHCDEEAEDENCGEDEEVGEVGDRECGRNWGENMFKDFGEGLDVRRIREGAKSVR
jgi:hypothetical protein